MNGIDSIALSSLVASAEAKSAPRDTALQAAAGVASVCDAAKISLSDIFEAMSHGRESEGDKALLVTLHYATKFIGTWGTLFILGVGFYEAAQMAVGVLERAWGVIGKAETLVTTGLTSLVHGAESMLGMRDQAPAAPSTATGSLASAALTMITTAVSTQVPVAGALFASIPGLTKTSDAGSPMPIDAANWARRGMKYDEFETITLDEED